ncbi:MAG: transcriptional regulator [Marinospirillum sp.]|uniref:hypothetical protein n=1 Tax=Marinospirillum sp. TaxID=2183934 RepID=UPI0019FC87E7|nr:hypothetical protein [Marinospirillum sp.]MBE0508016.1 transcriptional regulator [Marinospirillum sp.]
MRRLKQIQQTPDEVDANIARILHDHSEDQLTAGQLLKVMRRKFFGVTQESYAKAIGVSRRTLVQIESDDFGSVSFQSIQNAFRPFGMKLYVGVLPNRKKIREIQRAISVERRDADV